MHERIYTSAGESAEQDPQIKSASEHLARRNWRDLRFRRRHEDGSLEFDGTKDEIDGVRTATFKYHPGEEGEQGLLEIIESSDGSDAEEAGGSGEPEVSPAPATTEPPTAAAADTPEARRAGLESMAAEIRRLRTVQSELAAEIVTLRGAPAAAAGGLTPEQQQKLAMSDAALEALGLHEGTVARKTFEATFAAFPEIVIPAGATEAEKKSLRQKQALHEKARKAIAERRWKLFQEGERKSEKEDVRAIGEAILRFQEQPWYVRWGLSGVMGAAGKGALVALGGSALSAFATLGAVTSMPVSIPVAAAFAIGAGRYRQRLNKITSLNERGYGENPIVFKFPHTTAALSGILYGAMTYGGAQAALTPGGRLAVRNFFTAVTSKAGATLSQLLSHLSAGKALSVSLSI